MLTMSRFFKEYPLKHWPYYVAGFAALLLTNYVTIRIPLKIKEAIDLMSIETVSKGDVQAVAWQIALLALILFAARSLSRILIFIPGRLVEFRLRNDLYAHLMSLPGRFYRSQKIGDLMSRATNDLNNLRLMVGLAFLHIANTALMYVFVLSQMLGLSWRLTLCAVAPLPFVIFLVKAFVGKLYKYVAESQERLGRLTNFVVESLSGVAIVKSYAAEAGILEAFNKDNQAYQDVNIRLSAVRALMFPFMGLLGSMGNLVLFAVGGFWVLKGQVSLGTFVAFSAYIHMLAWPTAALAWIINVIQRGRVSFKRVCDVMNSPAEFAIEDTFLEQDKPLQTPDIQVKNLTCAFEGQEPVLKDLQFSLKPGERLGIFGPTGSGKTVLVKLMAALERAPKGQVFWDGKDIRDWPLEDLRKIIAYVPQDSFLFSQSILENIAYWDSQGIDEQAAVHAAEQASVHEDILKFSQNYSTIIGERGIILSGGQKNRVALARALYKPHKLLILDDVLSAVDHRTEEKMVSMLKNRPQDCSMLVVSHRVSALSFCQRILVLEHGQIVDSGSHEELIGREGVYRDTWLYQKMESDL